ncbi:peptidase c13 family protein [Stylonychia lemnae]|uniref:legumain n=1 Tax=Stylonychia lemnae TaxID=5949 RepID=A0A078B0U7_STYLE|nr:peptidase c13 family protein [Stylonychia lemnae]|eukprot:CDW88179.1 peptidase c13 family protein [Stylonychia lemnae]
MISNFSLIFTLIGVITAPLSFVSCEKDHWAVLVAGSNGFWNYRHQADVCHAYQILRKNGMPEENIIVFAYDDIANNPQNIFPGQIFNKPDGKDVYEGCKIDYKGDDVILDNFVNVLKGDHEKMKGLGNGKVLNSTKDSKVFVYFTDHGATGILGFPQKYLYADDLISNLTYMHKQNMYSELVFYVEACESGSMFQGLLDPALNIYVMTASNAEESSWGTYCYPDDLKDGKHLGTCLGDLFSVNWMEDTDANDILKESLLTQFETVKNKTDQSHVMQYGELKFVDEPIGYFQGNFDPKTIKAILKEKDQNSPIDEIFRDVKIGHKEHKNKQGFWDSFVRSVKEFVFTQQPIYDYKVMNKGSYKSEQDQDDLKYRSSINSRDIKLHYLYTRIFLDNYESPIYQLDLNQELNNRMRVDYVFEHFKNRVNQDPQNKNDIIVPRQSVLPRNFDCLRQLVEAYEGQCGHQMDEYEMQYVRYFVQACEKTEMTEENKSQKIHELREKIIDTCKISF